MEEIKQRMVPGAGIEPARCFHRGILSPLRLPISPSGHTERMGLTTTINPLSQTVD